MAPKVSVLVPVYNAMPFLDECLDSLEAQTLAEIEFICINDGSTDGSGKILEIRSAQDRRYRIAAQPNGGYGKAMNAALRMASGDYIGIVEPDDYVEPQMFEEMYALAAERMVDAVKGNYFRHSAESGDRLCKSLDKVGCQHGSIFCPREEKAIFFSDPAIWSAIYNRGFLLKNDIAFRETPGASFQDTSFNFKVWACARTAITTPQAYYHYRIDNASSSVKSRSKVDAIHGELDAMESFLESEQGLTEALMPVRDALLFQAEEWNLKRIAPESRERYLDQVRASFLAMGAERLQSAMSVMDQNRSEAFALLLERPMEFYAERVRIPESTRDLKQENRRLKRRAAELEKKNRALERRMEHLEHSASMHLGRALTWAPRKISSAIYSKLCGRNTSGDDSPGMSSNPRKPS